MYLYRGILGFWDFGGGERLGETPVVGEEAGRRGATIYLLRNRHVGTHWQLSLCVCVQLTWLTGINQ